MQLGLQIEKNKTQNFNKETSWKCERPRNVVKTGCRKKWLNTDPCNVPLLSPLQSLELHLQVSMVGTECYPLDTLLVL
jgi:hypothetical protein